MVKLACPFRGRRSISWTFWIRPWNRRPRLRRPYSSHLGNAVCIKKYNSLRSGYLPNSPPAKNSDAPTSPNTLTLQHHPSRPFSTLLYSTLYSTLLFCSLFLSTQLYSSSLCSIILYSTLLHSTIQSTVLQYSTLFLSLYSTLLYPILLYSALPYSILLYSILLYSILLFCPYSSLLLSTLLFSISFLNLRDSIVSHPNFLWWYISMYCFIFHVFYQMKLYKNYVWIRYQIKWYMR